MDLEILDKWREEYEERRKQERDKVMSCLCLADLHDVEVFELTNRYWPNHPRYFSLATPWYLIIWKGHRLVIGCRKKVIHLDWKGTPLRITITNDNVTKNDELVHAWSWEKLVEYLKTVRVALQEAGE